jgi:hypothetical protein
MRLKLKRRNTAGFILQFSHGSPNGSAGREMRHLKQIAIVLGIVLILLAVLLSFQTGTPESKSRKIAADLLELHRQWHITNDVPALFRSLTNLPFHDGSFMIGESSVARRHNVLGIKWDESYFIFQPQPVTNTSEWTLYHAWYWYPPYGIRKQFVTRKLVTVTTN